MIHRRVALAMCSLVTLGCASMRTHYESETIVTGVDFREHTREGFLFSPNAYAGAFEAVGMVTVSMFPEATWVQKQQKWVTAPLKLADVLVEARKSAATLGADAIVNVSFRSLSKGYTWGVISGVEVSGFAIKRSTR